MAKYKLTKNLGMLLLGIWLILTGLVPLLKLYFNGFPAIMQVLAIVAGAFAVNLLASRKLGYPLYYGVLSPKLWPACWGRCWSTPSSAAKSSSATWSCKWGAGHSACVWSRRNG